MLTAILDFLKKEKAQEYVSGEEISARLKISRQSLWKHIRELKEAGYGIAAVPHLGYRLVSSPDRLFPFEISSRLNTRVIGRRIFYFEEASSTMDLARKLAMEGSCEGTLVLAEAQSSGRGRLGREWFSPKYKGIYLSLILSPKASPGQASLLTLVSAVSICEALKEVADIKAHIKWPNDIISANKKLGGILTELDASSGGVRFVVIGIGLNVNNDKKTLPASATSVREQKNGLPVNRVELLQELLRRLEKNYLLLQKQNGPESIIDKWRSYNMTLGRRVKVVFKGKCLEGEAVDIDIGGGLLVRRDSGLVEKVMAGDVVHCR